MQRIPFKGLFIILIPCILLVGVIVPLAVFAKAPAHSSPTHSSSVQSSDELKSRLFAINNAATCNIPGQNDNPEVLFTFQAQAEVTGLTRIVSADVTEANEEVLVLKETKGPFTMTVQPNTGPHPFKFTATKNGDQLTACYTLIGHDDEGDMFGGPGNPLMDHPAAVSFTVEYGD